MPGDDRKQDWVLRAEGVNFGHTVFHTQNLAVIRGASATLETAMELGASDSLDAAMNGGVSVLDDLSRQAGVSGAPIYLGASQLAWRVEQATKAQALDLADGFRDWLARPGKEIPTEFMSILVDLAEMRAHETLEDGSDEVRPTACEFFAVNRAHVATRYRQMRAPNFPGFEGRQIGGRVGTTFAAICPIDGRRPVGQEPDGQSNGDSVLVPVERFPNAIEVGERTPQRKRILVSPNVRRLMDYGRRRRAQMYSDLLDGAFNIEREDLVKSFDELVDRPPDGLSESARGKMAVLYVDGAGFGALRDRVAPEHGLGAFSRVAKGMMDSLLRRAVSTFVTGTSNRYRAISEDDDGEVTHPIRFETLLRAGDEFCVVAPGWTAVELMQGWFEAAEAFNGDASNAQMLGGESLAIRIGCLICSQTTPIRKARDLAYVLQEEARCGPEKGGALIQMLESYEAPETSTGFGDYRGAQFGTRAPSAFVIPASRFTDTVGHVKGLKTRLPRSQLRKLIRLAAHEKPQSALAFADLISKSLARSEGDVTAAELMDARLNHTDAVPDFSLKFLDDLWDYVEPFTAGAGS